MHPLFALICLAVLVPAYNQNVQAPAAQQMDPAMYIRPHRGDVEDCVYYGRYYRHGQTFSLPGTTHCIQYICWYGAVHLRREACEVDNQCVPVGSRREVSCSTYTCSKTVGRSYNHYQPARVSSRCTGLNGRCHDPGTNFPFIMHGRYYNSCSCSVGHSVIRYNCTHRPQ